MFSLFLTFGEKPMSGSKRGHFVTGERGKTDLFAIVLDPKTKFKKNFTCKTN